MRTNPFQLLYSVLVMLRSAKSIAFPIGLRKSRSYQMSALNNALVIDTDVGFDDIISIQCLHLLDRARPSLITTVGGMSTSQNGADYLRALFPSKNVVAGSNSNPQTIPLWLHEYRRELRDFEVKLVKLNPVKGNERKFETKHECGEVEETLLSVRELLLKSPDKSVDVLCLGPLTNVAYWVQKEGPLLQQKINAIWIMGGNDLDSISQKPEFNFAQDPFATSTVLQTHYLADKIYIVTEAESSRGNFEGKAGGSFLESISCYAKSEAPEGILSQIFQICPTAIYYDPLSAFAYDATSSDVRCVDIRVSDNGLIRRSKKNDDIKSNFLKFVHDIDLTSNKGFIHWIRSAIEKEKEERVAPK